MAENIKREQTRRQTHRWSSDQTTALLEAILDKIKDNPESFEKPTAQKFYSTLFDNYKLVDIAELGISVVKNKVRNLRKTYLNAEDWKRQTGAGLIEDGNEKSVKDYIAKICPYFDALQEIFGKRKNVHTTTFDSEYSEDFFDEVIEYTGGIAETNLDGISSEKTEKEVFAPGPSTTDINDKETVDSTSGSKSISTSSVDYFKQCLKKPRKDCKRPVNSSLAYLAAIQEKKTDLDQMKFEKQIQIEEEKLNLDRERLNFEREKLKADNEIKKFEIEKQYELKKYELELKYKCNQTDD